MIVLATTLALAVLILILPVSRELAWTVAAGIVLLALAGIVLRTLRRNRARHQSAPVLAALAAMTADLPLNLRTRMPLVLVTGDALAHLFNREGGEAQLAHVGEGAIWLRVDEPGDLPRVSVAVEQWRAGRAPDGVMLSIAPATYGSEDALMQALRRARQALSDTTRALGTRMPAYLAIYQRLTASPTPPVEPQWHGVSSATALSNTLQWQTVVAAAESQGERASNDPAHAARVAALAAIVGWTERVVLGPLNDDVQPAACWPLWGIGWIDCGPASEAGSPWARDVHARSRIVPPPMPASPTPWPLPQPLIEAMPRSPWISPAWSALAHVIGLLACASALAIWGSAINNQSWLAHIGADLQRFATIPATHDTARRDALQALIAVRDQIDRYERVGVPLRLSFGMYRAAALIPVVNAAIASYAPLPAPPAIVTLDSMSLFDSGKAQLKPGSTRAMVSALELIEAHPDKRVLVAGHTDNVGRADRNQALSVARAGAVRDWLVEASGIALTQFAIQGYGDSRPIADNASEAGRAKNRRVEITLVPDSPYPFPPGTPAGSGQKHG
ncbi:OmpA family protein [Paraburkholderia sp. DHOC27]|nr:OmpA family protein [Paraburkholderia sp. DHOC27]